MLQIHDLSVITSALVWKQCFASIITSFLFYVLRVLVAFRVSGALVPFEVVLMEKVWTVVTCVTVICWI